MKKKTATKESAIVEAMPPIDDIKLVQEPEPKPTRTNVQIKGSARRAAHVYGRRMRNLWPQLQATTTKMIDANEIMPESVTTDNTTTIFLDKAELAARIFDRIIAASLANSASLDSVNEEVTFLLDQVNFLEKNGFGKNLDLETPRRVAAEVKNDLAMAVFGSNVTMRELQLRCATAADLLEAESVEEIEGSILEVAAHKGLDTVIIRTQIEKVWELDEKPKKKLIEVRRVMQGVPLQNPQARPLSHRLEIVK